MPLQEVDLRDLSKAFQIYDPGSWRWNVIRQVPREDDLP